MPTSGYRTEFYLRLPHATAAAEIVAHYRGELRAWREQRYGDFTAFGRGGVTITIAAIGSRVREYGVYVSQ